MEISREVWDTLTTDLANAKSDITVMQRDLRDLKLVVYGNSDLGIVGLQTIVKRIDDKLDELKVSVLQIQDNRRFVITMIGLLISMIGSVGALAGVIFVIAQNAQRVVTP